ncbi:phospholipase [Pseudoduganella albidiflava]|uniref:Phospholipase n=1 Tax=Pseudoduganella albidiflava TaxID=321983 RepID=A0ABX5S200_9BURK|nr:phospholipase [Pseudoduganella albidiflava]
MDIITWGFDPGMILVRKETAQSGQRYGDLLIEIATRKKNPVKVRLLIWHDDFVSQKIMNNTPGYYGPSLPTIGANGGVGYYSEGHQNYSAEWYAKVVNREFENICLHVRHVKSDLLGRSMEGEVPPKNLGFTGTVAVLYAAHHQKMILIDFERPKSAVGYVMGHNSTTEYWDTAEHIFGDIRRERVFDMPQAELLKRAWKEGPSFEGASPGYSPPPHLMRQKERAVQDYIDRHSRIVKPYQDVSCRVRGPVLHDLNHNFCQGWHESEPPGSAFLDLLWFLGPLRLVYKIVRAIRDMSDMQMDPGFIARRNKIGISEFPRQGQEHTVQLVRTQPLHGEKAAKECYANLTRQMTHYIFIQNQYIQYAAWAAHLRTCVHNLREAGYTKPVYVFLVTSTPERAGMDGPTHEVAGGIGQIKTMPRLHQEAVKVAERGGTRPPVSEEEMIESGINVVMSSMWTCSAASGKLLPSDYEEIYIHTKVAIVDDAAFTAGSTNLNLRSMAVDSELNLLSNAAVVAYDLRMKLFQQCAGKAGPGCFGDMSAAYNAWKSLRDDNLAKKNRGENLVSQLMPFYVDRKFSSSLI